MYYVLMNDYGSSLVPRYLQAIIDTVKQVNEKWEYEGSKYSFPYFMKERECPENLFLLCRSTIGKLSFSFYHHGVAQILSDDFSELIESSRKSKHYSRNMTATSIKDGEVLRDDLRYYHFSGEEGFIDFSKSKIEEDKIGNLIPYNLVFNDNSLNYDVFSINDTLLAGFLFVSESIAELSSKIKGVKVVPLDKALEVYCVDYKYDLDSNRKKIKKKLP